MNKKHFHHDLWWETVKRAFIISSDIKCPDCGFRVRDLTRFSPIQYSFGMEIQGELDAKS